MRCVHTTTRIEKFAKFIKQLKMIITKELIVKNVRILIQTVRIISNYAKHITVIHQHLIIINNYIKGERLCLT